MTSETDVPADAPGRVCRQAAGPCSSCAGGVPDSRGKVFPLPAAACPTRALWTDQHGGLFLGDGADTLERWLLMEKASWIAPGEKSRVCRGPRSPCPRECAVCQFFNAVQERRSTLRPPPADHAGFVAPWTSFLVSRSVHQISELGGDQRLMAKRFCREGPGAFPTLSTGPGSGPPPTAPAGRAWRGGCTGLAVDVHSEPL